MQVASEYGPEYWDGDRRFGYGGYRYDGRQRAVAEGLISAHGLAADARILDVGCGTGFLLYEFTQLLPQVAVVGIDRSAYALEHAKEEVRSHLFQHAAEKPLPFADKEFDLVVSITTLHNLPIRHLGTALQEIQRVGRRGYVVVESYRNCRELFNLECWALTCQSFFGMEDWLWLFGHFGYQGDYEFIFFE
jgi:ubiquinone/menaquinone biosynthesis C-methylase UbiE